MYILKCSPSRSLNASFSSWSSLFLSVRPLISRARASVSRSFILIWRLPSLISAMAASSPSVPCGFIKRVPVALVCQFSFPLHKSQSDTISGSPTALCSSSRGRQMLAKKESNVWWLERYSEGASRRCIVCVCVCVVVQQSVVQYNVSIALPLCSVGSALYCAVRYVMLCSV